MHLHDADFPGIQAHEEHPLLSKKEETRAFGKEKAPDPTTRHQTTSKHCPRPNSQTPTNN
jgi:hypothetical protein